MNLTKHYDVIIIGAGFSGCVVATHLNKNIKVLVLDTNKIILKKFLITGKGYANITNTSTVPKFLENIIDNNKFMYSSLSSYAAAEILSWCDELQIRYFEKTPHRIHLIDSNEKFKLAIENKMQTMSNLQLRLETPVEKVFNHEEVFYVECGANEYSCKQLVVSTGGLSFPKTGCQGIGYKIAESFGHTVNPLYAIGVGVFIDDPELIALQGASIDTVKVSVLNAKSQCIYQETGSLIVTHYGLGGPVIRRVSGYISQLLLSKEKVSLVLEIYPADEVEKILKNNTYLGQCFKLLNARLLEYLYKKIAVDRNLTTANLNKAQHQTIIQTFSQLTYEVQNVGDINEAINTGGGVITKMIDPKSMESKLLPNLYFIGEVLDVNPRTNGFNLTVCFATACACAQAINTKYKI